MLSRTFKSELWVRSRLMAGVLVCVHLMAYGALGQAGISAGGVQGTVSDSSGTVIGGAKITIASRETGQVIHLKTTAGGIYTCGLLRPGNYLVQVENPGFKQADLLLLVQVGVTSSANIKLQVGATTDVVEVHDSYIRANTEQATIQGVLTEPQIETLPVNGRTYIDLAQLEPGIQTHDTSASGPTGKEASAPQ